MANVGGTRTLSAPQSSGCLTFASWSDGGAATHNVVVGATPQTYTASFSGSCGSGSNLLQNPGFESGLTGWTPGTIVTSPVHSGTRALQINARSSAARTSTQTVAVTGGTTYEVSGWLSVANVARAARIIVQWRDASGTLLRSDPRVPHRHRRLDTSFGDADCPGRSQASPFPPWNQRRAGQLRPSVV